MVTAKNPILAGFCPDPSICAVGGDFYIAVSSFAYFPGIPIFHTRDFCHIRQIGNALTRPSQLHTAGIRSSQGIFAPTLRYHNGTFYLIVTIEPAEKTFVGRQHRRRGRGRSRILCATRSALTPA